MPGVVPWEVAHPQASESQRGDHGQHDFTCDFAESEGDYGDVEEDVELDVIVVFSMTEKLRDVAEMNDSNGPMAWQFLLVLIWRSIFGAIRVPVWY